MWNVYFKQLDFEWQLHNLQLSFMGFKQISHRKLVEIFDDEFFANIQEIFKIKGRFVAEAYYYGL